MFSSYPKEAKQLLAAEQSHLLSVDKIKHKYEKTTRFVALAQQVSRDLIETSIDV